MTLVAPSRFIGSARSTGLQVEWGAPAPGGVAHVVNSTRWGGMEARTLETAQWQARSGYATVIVTPGDGALFEQARGLGLPVEAVDFEGGDKLHNLLRLRAIFRRCNVVLADFHTNRSLAFGLRDLATLVRTQHVLRRGRGRALRLNREYPYDGFILSSQAGADVLVEQGYARASRISVVGEWAHARFFAPAPSRAERAEGRRRLGLPSDELLIGAAAMLRPDNAFDDLIRATARLRGQGLAVSCLVIGAGAHLHRRGCAEVSALRGLACALGVERYVRFLGHRTDVSDLLGLMDVVAIVSRHTAQTRVAPEAAARGRPVVGFDVGALRETIRDAQTGRLVPPGDLGAFTEALAQLLTHPAERERMGRAAVALARRRFTEDAKMELTLRSYEQAALRRRSALRPLFPTDSVRHLKAA